MVGVHSVFATRNVPDTNPIEIQLDLRLKNQRKRIELYCSTNRKVRLVKWMDGGFLLVFCFVLQNTRYIELYFLSILFLFCSIHQVDSFYIVDCSSILLFAWYVWRNLPIFPQSLQHGNSLISLGLQWDFRVGIDNFFWFQWWNFGWNRIGRISAAEMVDYLC